MSEDLLYEYVEAVRSESDGSSGTVGSMGSTVEDMATDLVIPMKGRITHTTTTDRS